MKLYKVDSKITGGHYAFKTEKSKKPFENPMNYYSKANLSSNDVVIDIGAYVGEYTLYAVRQGVKKVIAYEPTPDSFKALQLNTSRFPNITAINAAIVGDNSHSVNLFLSKGIGVTNSIVKKRAKKGAISVSAVNYNKAVSDATVVKIDVEGAEYTYDIPQDNLRVIILEFHPLEKVDWREKASVVMNHIESNGFKCLFKPTFKCGWDLTGVWEKY